MIAQAAPKSTPPRIIAAMITGPLWSRSASPAPEAPTAPRYSCPSAPMFQSLIRNAAAAARPVSSVGVAVTRVLVSAPGEMKARSKSRA